MFNPYSFIGMLGLGLPEQTPEQQIAQSQGVNAMAGGGRRRRNFFPGTAGSIGFTPSVGAMTPSPRAMPTPAPDMLRPAIPAPNDNGMSRGWHPEIDMRYPMGAGLPANLPSTEAKRAGLDIGDFQTPSTFPGSEPRPTANIPLPPTVQNPELVKLRGEMERLGSFDPSAVAQAQWQKTGVLDKILGALQGFGQGGIIGGIQSIRGIPQRQAYASQAAAMNEARMKQLQDRIELEKEIAGEEDRQRQRDISQGNLTRENLALDETMAEHRRNDERERSKLQLEATRFERDDATRRQGQLVDVINTQMREQIPTSQDIFGMKAGTVADSSKIQGLDADAAGNRFGVIKDPTAPGGFRQIQLTGDRMFKLPPSSGGGSAADRIMERQIAQEERESSRKEAYRRAMGTIAVRERQKIVDSFKASGLDLSSPFAQQMVEDMLQKRLQDPALEGEVYTIMEGEPNMKPQKERGGFQFGPGGFRF